MRNYRLSKEFRFKTASLCFENAGFHIKPKNKIQYEGIVVNDLNLYDTSSVSSLIKKKIKRKLSLYFNYLSTYIEEGGEDGSTDLRHALNDLTRFREIINQKYQKYLSEKYKLLLFKKLDSLEADIDRKMVYENTKQIDTYYHSIDTYEKEKGKAR